MGKLEREIGALLVARAGRGVTLTPAGEVFLGRARRILALADEAIQAARYTAGGRTGELSVGHNTAAEFGVFPAVLPAFRQAWPQVGLKFHNLRAVRQLEGLRQGDLDVAFVWRPVPPEFDVAELSHEPLAAVLPVDHPLAEAPHVTVADLAREPLVTFSRALDPESALEIEQLFRRAGAEMRVVQELDTM